MPVYRADLHIHTVLSPCGDLGMSPVNIVNTALERKLDIIGITDHNSTLHCELIKKLASEHGILVLPGAEVTTREEIHCLTFFENTETLNAFQEYLDKYLIRFPNDVNKFGYQVVVDEDENILQHIEWLLISSIDQSIDEVEAMVHSLGGLFIPAHIDKPANSLLSQLGFIPPDLKADAYEISAFANTEKMKKMLPQRSIPLIRNSDAHITDQIGKETTLFEMMELTFSELRLALRDESGRKTIVA
ncbi:MAG TPA: PHP-associated domain-containing protein [Bacteroidales bacterium]|jgi:PHP family Zn ribbon phosphoesterase|nr:PHP-associated domain-containing protein [Bacteroidales bacterium]